MKYKLYDDNYTPQGSFSSIQELRNYLCDRKYEFDCDKDIFLKDNGICVHICTKETLDTI